MDINAFRPVTGGPTYILTGRWWFPVATDGFEWLQVVSVDEFYWSQMDSCGCRWFAVLIAGSESSQTFN